MSEPDITPEAVAETITQLQAGEDPDRWEISFMLEALSARVQEQDTRYDELLAIVNEERGYCVAPSPAAVLETAACRMRTRAAEARQAAEPRVSETET